MDKHPDYVIKRYESGGVATNAECDAIYMEALRRVEGKVGGISSPSHRSSPATSTSSTIVQSTPLQYSRESNRSSNTGMKGNPVHVVLDEGDSYLDSQ